MKQLKILLKVESNIWKLLLGKKMLLGISFLRQYLNYFKLQILVFLRISILFNQPRAVLFFFK